jgi:hypothetical protein
VSSTEVINRINASGISGIKKTDLSKEFQNMQINEIIELLVTKGDIVMEKKGSAYYLWQTDKYLENLLISDPKFRIIYNAIVQLKDSVKDNSKLYSAANFIHKSSPCQNGPSMTAVNNYNELLIADTEEVTTFDQNQFKEEFDLIMKKYSNSSGWIPLARIREEFTKKYKIGTDYFYALIEDLTNKEYDKYELSSGGSEGLTIRGLLHGFVRCI